MNSGASFPYPSVKINLGRQAAARQWKILWFASLRCSGRAASNEKEMSDSHQGRALLGVEAH
jgi:hypothetical protein